VMALPKRLCRMHANADVIKQLLALRYDHHGTKQTGRTLGYSRSRVHVSVPPFVRVVLVTTEVPLKVTVIEMSCPGVDCSIVLMRVPDCG
jgi:hypothetical protein